MHEGGRLTTLHELFGVSDPGGGQASMKFYELTQKLLSAPPDFEKNIALAFLKAAWLQIPYWVYFTFKV